MNNSRRIYIFAVMVVWALGTAASAYDAPPVAVSSPDPEFWPLDASGFVDAEICGGNSYDPDWGSPYCCERGIASHDWFVWPTCGSGLITHYYTEPYGPTHSCAYVRFTCLGRHYVYQWVTDFGGLQSDSTTSYVWAFDISASLSQSVIGVGDTATLTMNYSPSNLPGFEKLTLNTAATGVVEVLDGTQTVISGSDYSQLWPLPSTPSGHTVTVKGCSPSIIQPILSLQFTPNGSTFPYSTYNGNSVSVTVVGVSEIDVYAASQWYDVTNFAITVLKGTKYTFKAKKEPVNAPWPSQRPIWTLNGSQIGTGVESVEVTFDTVGTETLVAKAGLNDSGKTVTITVVQPTLYQFGASGNHTLYVTPISWAGWADGSVAFSNPVYSDDPANPQNDPLCVTKNSNTVSLTGVTLQVLYGGLSFPTTVRIDAAGTEDWNESGDVSFYGVTSSGATLPITGNIINEVHKYDDDFQIQWKYKVPGGTNTWYDIGTTSHTMYVKYGDTTGGQSLTEKRIEWLCRGEHCGGNTTTLQCSDDIYTGLSGSPPKFLLGGGSPSNKWQMMDPDGPSGDCLGLALLMQDMYQLLGCGDGEIGYVYGTTDSNCYSTSDSASEPRTCPGGTHGTETIRFYAGGWNYWEAVFAANGWYYAVKIAKSQQPVDIIKSILGANNPDPNNEGTHQAWVHQWTCCTDPGLHPAPLP